MNTAFSASATGQIVPPPVNSAARASFFSELMGNEPQPLPEGIIRSLGGDGDDAGEELMEEFAPGDFLLGIAGLIDAGERRLAQRQIIMPQNKVDDAQLRTVISHLVNGFDWRPAIARSTVEELSERKIPKHHREQERTVPPARVLDFTIPKWLTRDLPEPDFLLGDVFSTTSRAMLVGPTGRGKSTIGMAAAFCIADGRAFLHWQAGRPAKVLYIDGEMSARLARRRLQDAVQRHGYAPERLIFINRDDWSNMLPLDAPEGQQFIDNMIAQAGGIDFVFFDNVQSLISGVMKDEEPWAAVLPWVRGLTRRSIGQLWMHHTGHDASRSYGTKTREWQLDTVMLMKPRDETDEILIDFDLEFTKARERSPDNRADFATARLWIDADDRWQSSITPAAKPGQETKLNGKDKAALASLHDILADEGKTASGNRTPGGMLTVTVDRWRDELKQRGLYDSSIGKSRQWFYEVKTKLIAAGRIAIDRDHVWAVQRSMSGG